MKTHLAYLAVIALFIGVAMWGWVNYFGSQMTARGDVREASYLAVDFADFCRVNHRLPSASEEANFSTRLMFVELRDQQYIYKCGLFGRDSLVVESFNNGALQFRVQGTSFR